MATSPILAEPPPESVTSDIVLDEYEQRLLSITDDIKNDAHTTVKEDFVDSLSQEEKYGYCFDAWESFEVKKKAQDFRGALFHLQRAVLVSMTNKLYRSKKQTKTTRHLANAVLDMLKKVEDEYVDCEDGIYCDLMDEKRLPEAKLLLKIVPRKRRSSSASKSEKASVVLPAEGEDIPEERLKVFEIIGDGHCAFRAISQGLHDAKLTVQQEAKAVPRLRQFICRKLHSQQDTVLKNGLTVSNVIMLEGSDRYNNMSQYIRAMMRSAYAGEIELWLMAIELEVKVSVFKYDGDNALFKHMQAYGTKGKRIFLLWTPGKHGEGGNHYDLLVAV